MSQSSSVGLESASDINSNPSFNVDIAAGIPLLVGIASSTMFLTVLAELFIRAVFDAGYNGPPDTVLDFCRMESEVSPGFIGSDNSGPGKEGMS